MKILQFHTSLTNNGGIETMICHLSNEMAKTHDVKICVAFLPPISSPYYNCLTINVKKEHLGIIKNGFSIRNILRIFKYIKNSDAKIIHIHGFFYYYMLPIILLHNKFKFVYTFHSDAYMENSKWDKRVLGIKRFCLNHRWIQPVTISLASKQSFFDLYHVESKLISNGIPRPQIENQKNVVDEAKINCKTKVFVHPGRISRPKNQVVLCSVFKRLIDEGFDVVLLIAGANQDEHIMNRIKPFLSKRIQYIGDRNDIPQLLARADGLCLPSLWEGLPVTILEALSVGCIPICSPVGGIVNVIQDGKNGILSESSSEEDYYHAMKSYLNMDSLHIDHMRKEVLKSFPQYDITTTTNQYISLYNELLGGDKQCINKLQP